MATGAASQLAGPAGLGELRVPLLWLTIAAALTVIGAGAFSEGRRRGTPAARLGDFTVPIGLAVIGSGLTRLGASSLATDAAVLVVASAFVATGVLVANIVVPMAISPPALVAVGGTWFLAPAALLADAVGAAAVASKVPHHAPAVEWLALGAAAVGVVGYLLVVGLAVARVALHRLAGVPRAPWWIAAGCGGLSAAALGRVGAVYPGGSGLGTLHGFGWAALACLTIGSVALIPVLGGSLRYLMELRHVAGRPPWPPTFSTGVYALGAGQVGRLLTLPLISDVADMAAVATICLWAATVAVQLPRRLGRLRLAAAGCDRDDSSR